MPPNINRSRWKFTVDRDGEGKPAILFGLGAIKGVGEGAVHAIIRERESNGAYRDIFDFCRRIDPSECGKRVTESLIKAGAFDSLGANRPQMLVVYEGAMDANQNTRRKNVAGQVSLFDMMGEAGEAPLIEIHQKLPPVPDCPQRVKLQMEKEAAGVYMTGHPLEDYRDVLSQMTLTTADLEQTEDAAETEIRLDGREVVMGGMLTEVKGKATKKGDYMAFVTLEDMTGQIECLVFPKVFERYQSALQEDEAVVINGRISVREDEAPKLLAEKITPIDEWKKQARQPEGAGGGRMAEPGTRTDAAAAGSARKKLFLRLERKDMDRAAAMLGLNPGSIPVYMHLPAEKTTLLAPRGCWCDGSEKCLSRLREALGGENVVMKG